MSKYAKTTTVSPEKSLAEIQKLLQKYDAKKFGYIQDENRAGLAFEMSNRQLRFILPLPKLSEFTYGKGYRIKTESQIKSAYEQATRQRWRALLLAIKAKLESVESGIETFEEAFMAHIVLPSGQTIGEWATPQIESTYSNNNMPPLLGKMQ